MPCLIPARPLRHSSGSDAGGLSDGVRRGGAVLPGEASADSRPLEAAHRGGAGLSWKVHHGRDFRRGVLCEQCRRGRRAGLLAGVQLQLYLAGAADQPCNLPRSRHGSPCAADAQKFGALSAGGEKIKVCVRVFSGWKAPAFSCIIESARGGGLPRVTMEGGGESFAESFLRVHGAHEADQTLGASAQHDSGKRSGAFASGFDDRPRACAD